MTQLIKAKSGKITFEMEQIATREGIAPEVIRKKVAAGELVIPKNKERKTSFSQGFGAELKTKISTSVGLYDNYTDLKTELNKVDLAVELGTDAIMDLSKDGDIDNMRRQVLDNTELPVGTLPIYQAAKESQEKTDSILDMTVDDIFNIVEKQAADGVDFMGIHAGLKRDILDRLKFEGRVEGLVSHGGQILAGWMLHNDCENPFYEHYDRLLEIAKEYDVTISLADTFRPGAIEDSLDRAQVQELIILGELVEEGWNEGVQMMVKGPGHIPLDQIESTVQLQKELCHGAPYFTFGPLVTDLATGYDDINSAIGGAHAAAAGADLLCYVTPVEHLDFPTKEDIQQGVMAAKIAAQVGDLSKGDQRAWELEEKMAQARKELDWKEEIELALNPKHAEEIRSKRNPAGSDGCAMCGEYCAIKVVNEYLN
ncbi:phosphomethylpyrimidine synthase ThiC [Acetohalobium arabaticum]|uniref:Phosphomethylpyrimidine synthase n=1 Tax=Acetohalobium arabaticum (strain ATCC 49924 / DSM 5501 / Z-7288) TaxID=574087 RepID=D9QVN8_ACEAZ|nr:phosphomethylpyrimidine synthase ThiC [Acetohalobium arabaticum]ADL12297.1 hydroxymethylpyrimidine synthase [Acetohalobium arabaticum DSM 5501]